MQLQPQNTTIGDLCTAALRECGAFGLGQTPTGDDISDTWARAQWMLQQWERKRWLVYQLATVPAAGLLSTGAQSYTIGPGGQIDTGTGSVRPAKVESAFARQQISSGNPIDYPLEILQSKEDYNRIALKSLASFPEYIFLDPGWPLGTVYVWPLMQANIYSLFVTIMTQLQYQFATAATVINLPFEYYGAILYNLALRLRSRYSIPSYPGDPLQGLAKDALNVLRQANAAIPRLVMPAELGRPGIYNVFSDQMY